MRRPLVVLVGLATLFASVAVASSGGATEAQARWVVRDLGTLGRGFDSSEATAINDQGQIVGTSANVNDGESDYEPSGHAFLWDNGKMRPLGALSGRRYSWATGINNRGQVVGSSYSFDNVDGRLTKASAVVWEKGRIRALSVPRKNEAEAFAINDAGDIVGWAGTYYGAAHAVLWQQGKVADLGAGESMATDLNERLKVVGIVGSDNGSGEWEGLRGFVWAGGVTRSLGSLGGYGTRYWHENWVSAISDRDEIVGAEHGHATVWRYGVPHTLTGMSGAPRQRSWANGINRQGWIVGEWRRTSDSSAHAALWDNGKLTLLPNLPGSDEAHATAINIHGQIVGYASARNGRLHAVLWTLKRG